MCRSHLHRLLCSLPKVEQHMHLEGALSIELLFRLADKNNVTLPKQSDPAFASVEALTARYSGFANLDDFLRYYFIGMSVLITASDFEDLAMDYFKRAAADGVVHAELFFDPQAHLVRDVSMSTIIAGFTSARLRAQDEYGITSELICCFLRHLPTADSEVVFDDPDLQAAFRRKSVIGIGIDSSEKDFPPKMFASIYNKARASGLKLTAHAGEEGPPEYITGALEELQVQRIDHGIRLADDDALMRRVAREGTLLTVCPLSNLLLQCTPSIDQRPIRKFLDAGVKFSINSDDPAYFGGYIQANYCAVQDAFDLDVKDWHTICGAAIDGSWCSRKRKLQLHQELEDAIRRGS